MKRVLSVFGTRPEAIKMAPVVKELEKRKDIESIVCVTAQHRDMLDQVLEIFKIKPDYDLNIMKPGQTLSYITAEVIKELEKVIIEVKPDIVLVHGDTTTSMAAALAAFYQHVDVGHVEAGLRTYDKYSPFPEEINRQVIDKIADYLFAPTSTSCSNICGCICDDVKFSGNIIDVKSSQMNKGQKIYITGNTVIDALKTTVTTEYKNEILDWVGNDRMVLVTAHRRENLGEPMRRIFRAMRKIIDEFEDVKLIYPVHLNPKVQEAARSILGDSDRIRLIDPLDAFDFHNFMDKAYFIMSDSGGVQEEAPALGKPVLVLRDTTERPEGIKAGTLKLVGTNEKEVYNAAKLLLTNKEAYDAMSKANNPYGDGFASKYIVDAILENERG
jgi:UDP-N-acetylglucosamine 2-epimerase (non-hydrolysing)